MGDTPTDEQLLAAVDEAGWLLEHRALRALEDRNWHPRPGWAFQDPDEPTKSRELDMWSYRQFWRDEGYRLRVTARLLVECKQSAQPFAAVGHVVPTWRQRGNPAEHVLPVENYSTVIHDPPGSHPGSVRYRGHDAWDWLGFRQLERHSGDDGFRVTQMTKLNRAKGGWDATNAGIFTSLVYPLAKALRASQARLQTPRRIMEGDGFPRRESTTTWLDVGLHFPVILISSPLFVIDATGETPRVEQRNWVRTTRELKSANVQGTFDIDVVTETAFPQYVESRARFASAVAELVADDPMRVTGENF
jgi:hypothetical protein